MEDYQVYLQQIGFPKTNLKKFQSAVLTTFLQDDTLMSAMQSSQPVMSSCEEPITSTLLSSQFAEFNCEKNHLQVQTMQ